MDAKEIFGWNLRKARIAKGLTQEALALEADVDRAYLGRIERGKENVTINVIEMLSRKLDAPLDKLFQVPPKDEPKPLPLKAGRRPGKRV
ncbi:helix-turn-helix domain-containing protein [Rhizobium jaguaris]|uniref:XRE family transcriptional regulator n=1 Tax=Rhizobium jaguaris TaxID=1312183 RepID=A0A387FVH0_9HYPH|nr:helix-turn-helix transcriptional regulator [Rhizobium jaguaris]AYG61145.1 XRE family transcriptional regulator [Rhizobium jaguaris]